MATPWNDDPAGYDALILANLSAQLLGLISESPARKRPVISQAQNWHRAVYAGVPLPVDYYAGEVRDTDPRFPELIGYEVTVGATSGAPSGLVPDELIRFEAAVDQATRSLDVAIPPGAQLDSPQLLAVLRLMALVHGEWVRIHPFANGNGRTARLWANWIALRYGLDAFVRLKPRPASLLYAGASAASMRGDHGPMLVVFYSMLRDYLAP